MFCLVICNLGAVIPSCVSYVNTGERCSTSVFTLSTFCIFSGGCLFVRGRNRDRDRRRGGRHRHADSWAKEQPLGPVSKQGTVLGAMHGAERLQSRRVPAAAGRPEKVLRKISGIACTLTVHSKTLQDANRATAFEQWGQRLLWTMQPASKPPYRMGSALPVLKEHTVPI